MGTSSPQHTVSLHCQVPSDWLGYGLASTSLALIETVTKTTKPFAPLPSRILSRRKYFFTKITTNQMSFRTTLPSSDCRGTPFTQSSFGQSAFPSPMTRQKVTRMTTKRQLWQVGAPLRRGDGTPQTFYSS